MSLLQSVLQYLQARALLDDCADRHFMADEKAEQVVAEVALTAAEQIEETALKNLRAAAQAETAVIKARAA